MAQQILVNRFGTSTFKREDKKEKQKDFVNIKGDSMTGNLNMGQNKVINLGTPKDRGDAMTLGSFTSYYHSIIDEITKTKDEITERISKVETKKVNPTFVVSYIHAVQRVGARLKYIGPHQHGLPLIDKIRILKLSILVDEDKDWSVTMTKDDDNTPLRIYRRTGQGQKYLIVSDVYPELPAGTILKFQGNCDMLIHLLCEIIP